MNFFINETFSNSYSSTIDNDILYKNTNYKRLVFDIIEETYSIYYESLKRLYTKKDIVTESANTGIFLDTNRFIITNFIKQLKDIKDLYKNNVKTFFSYNKDEIDYIKKNKKVIMNFNGNSIKITGYYFTEFNTVPVYIVNEIFDDMMKIFDHNIDDVYDNIKNKFNNGYFENLRKDILGTKSSISKKDFHKRTYAFFRDNKLDPDTINININYIKEYINRLEEKEYINSVNNLIDEIIDQLNCVNKVLEDFIKSEYIDSKKKLLDILNPVGNNINSNGYYNLGDDDIELDDDFNKQLFNILKAKSMQIIKIIEMYGEIISCKIEAMNEAIVQNKFICIVLLDNLVNNGGVGI